MVIFQILLLVFLTRFVIAANKPLLCSGLYTAGCFVMGLVWILGVQHLSFSYLLLQTTIAFGFSSIYFWLLSRIEKGVLWWVVEILGPVFVLIAWIMSS